MIYLVFSALDVSADLLTCLWIACKSKVTITTTTPLQLFDSDNLKKCQEWRQSTL